MTKTMYAATSAAMFFMVILTWWELDGSAEIVGCQWVRNDPQDDKQVKKFWC